MRSGESKGHDILSSWDHSVISSVQQMEALSSWMMSNIRREMPHRVEQQLIHLSWAVFLRRQVDPKPRRQTGPMTEVMIFFHLICQSFVWFSHTCVTAGTVGRSHVDTCATSVVTQVTLTTGLVLALGTCSHAAAPIQSPAAKREWTKKSKQEKSTHINYDSVNEWGSFPSQHAPYGTFTQM